MQSPIHDILEAVNDERTFLEFVRALHEDRADEVQKEKASRSNPYGLDANGWENSTIEQFLASAIAWAESTNLGLTQGLSQNNPWKRFAVFLYCGKIYE